MRQLCFTQADTRRGSLMLVNARHPHHLQKKALGPLVPLSPRQNRRVLLCSTAARLLLALLARVDTRGQICAVSGYRTAAQQRRLYSEASQTGGAAYAGTYVALPGCSEHETGLAVDLAAAVDTEQTNLITPNFPDGGVFARFRQRTAEYGFILRYPQDKAEVTGIGFEPWHFRYVGPPHAAIMAAQNLVLEEYLQLLTQYNSPGEALAWRQGGRRARVWRLPVPSGQNVELPLCTNNLWQASGDNAGGMVVTLWD